jgi:hypothetical protein
MAKEIKKIRLIEELPNGLRTKAKKLMEALKFVAAERKQAEEAEKVCKAEILTVIQELEIDTLVSEGVGKATISVKFTTTIKEDLLVDALKEAGVSQRKIDKIITTAKVETVSNPFILFYPAKEKGGK